METLLPIVLSKIPVEVAILVIAILMFLMFAHFNKRFNKKREETESCKEMIEKRTEALRKEMYESFLKPQTFTNQCHATMAEEREHTLKLIVESSKEITFEMKQNMTEFKADLKEDVAGFKEDIKELRAQVLLKLDKLNGRPL